MIIDKSLISKMKEFGLNSYEIKIWSALLARGSATAGELAEISNVPRSRSYDILESLEKKGFVVSQFGKPIRYLAIEPAEAVNRVKASILKDAEENIQILEEIKTSPILKELNQLYENGIGKIDPLEISGAIKTRKNVHDHLRFLISNSEDSIELMSTEAAIINKVNNLLFDLKKAKERGVKIRIAVPHTNENKESLKLLKDVAELKNAKHIRSRFGVFDGQHSVLFITPEDVNPGIESAIWVKSQHLGDSLKNVFEHVWENI
jgi:sugar-specific transcriptional regulator TrmB